MTREECKELFNPWFERITDIDLKNIAHIAFDKLPEYFFVKPASSTGKYHPRFADSDGGLVRHTLYALEVWKYLWKGFSEDFDKNPFVYECGIIAVMFHDALKYGNLNDALKYTTKTHPEDAAEWITQIIDTYATSQVEESQKFFDMCFEYIVEPIEHHQGPWSNHGAPKALMEQLVFIADYVASQPIFEKEIFRCVNN